MLALSQAMIGAVSANFRTVELSHRENRWHLLFVLAEDRLDDRTEIEDIATEFEALQGHGIDYALDVQVNTADLSWPEAPARVVFRRREL